MASQRTKINSPERKNYSNRAFKGDLEVILNHCPNCHHHKAFEHIPLKADMRIKCTRCKELFII